MTQPTQAEGVERDLAHEADMERLRREQLRGEDFDGEELMGDPDEYDEEDDHLDEYPEDDYCYCSVNHDLDEQLCNQCKCCGKAIE